MATTSDLYTDLSVSRQEIRLLKLQPSANSSSPVEASLSVESLDDNPSYVALTYVWGQKKDSEPISLSGREKTAIKTVVTENLLVALKALRDRETTRTLWIDALCINQTDPQEKGHQIGLMKDIYQRSAFCWIFLGEENTKIGTDATVMLLKSWASNEHHLGSRLNFNGDCINIATELTKRDWFKRVWTVQEAILPKNIAVFCGSKEISWTLLVHAAKVVQKHLATCCKKHNDTENEYMKDVIEFRDAVLTIERNRKSLHTEANQTPGRWGDILTCLHYYRDRQATNPQDKVFGLRGLMDTEDQKLIEIDVEASVEDVYARVCKNHVIKTGSLDILKYVLWSEEYSSILEKKLPSWVPDWTLAIPEHRWQNRRMNRYSLYDACGPQKGQPDFESAPGVLKERGVRCGVVAEVGSMRPTGWSDANKEVKEEERESARWKNIMWWKNKKPGQRIPEDWRTIAELDEKPEKLPDFWKTLIMDTIGESADRNATLRNAADTDYKDFEKLLTQVANGTGWPADTKRIYMALETATLLRRFFVTEDGSFGMGPARMKKNDLLYVVRGGKCPLVLQPCGETGNYKLVGDCFLMGCMKGEALGKVDAWDTAEMVHIE